MLHVGDPAPEFSATAHDGETVSLAQLRGKSVVLWFYPKADTPGWTVQGNGFRDGIHEFASRDAVILGISFDTPAENAAFAEKFSFPFQLLSDPDRSIGQAYGAADSADQEYAKRITYVIDPEGRISQSHGTVDVKTHASDVLAGL